MNCKIPFTKDIDFEKKLHEITSISLEHEIKIENDTLKGNFIVSGDFKSHEVSVNKEPFSYILPFEIALTPEIDPDSIEFMIEDFTYDVVDNSILRVNIDFNVIGSVKEKEEETREEPAFLDTLNVIEELKNEEVKEEVKEEVLDNQEERKENMELEEEKEEEVISKEEIPSEDAIISNFSITNDEDITYHIHMVNEGETVETICTMYNSNINILSEYNDLTNLTSGDKLIIPDKNE